MNALRKVFGLLIIVFLGMPTLFGIIWAVGMTRAVVSPEFISDLPQEIIAEVPILVDEIFEEARDTSVIANDNTRAWFEAADRVGTTPRELMKRIGLLDWLENELAQMLTHMGEVLRGEKRARTLVFDLRPLKNALSHEELDQYLLEILATFPPCDDDDIERWQDAMRRGDDWLDLPACQPDLAVAQQILQYKHRRMLQDIPDEVEIFKNVRTLPFGISRTVEWLSYGLFLFPALFIFLGAILAATSTGSFFRWFGLSVLLGALVPLGTALFARYVVPLAFNFAPYSYSDNWSTELQDLILEKTVWIRDIIFDRLFTPVLEVAGVVCVIGLLIFVFSLAMRTQPRPVVGSQSSQPAGGASPAPPATQESTPEPKPSAQTQEQEDQPEEKKKEE